MKSGFKLALLIGLLAALVFAATVISQLSPRTEKSLPGQPGAGEAALPPPLGFTFLDVHYDPKAAEIDYPYRFFPGFFEVGTGGSDSSRNWVGFAMRNLRGTPALLSPLPPSCGKCTTARGMTVPPNVMNEYFQNAALGNWFSSPFALNPLAAVAWAQTHARCEWMAFDFGMPDKMLTIPPGSVAEPSWVLLELDFKIYSEGPPTPVFARFDLFDTNKERLIPAPYEFKVTYAGREAFEVWPREIKAGELPEGIQPQSYDVYALSMTRDEIPPPVAAVNGNDPTISFGKPVKLDSAECAQLAGKLTRELNSPIRVRSAWRMTMTLSREANGVVPEAGDFEKAVEFSNPVTLRTAKLPIKGQIIGPVRLESGTKIELGSYESNFAVTKQAKFVSERTTMELELVPERCSPEFLQLTLGKPEVAFGRKSWPLTITIAEQQGRRPPWVGTVVLREKGPNGAIFRFPITGHGR